MKLERGTLGTKDLNTVGNLSILLLDSISLATHDGSMVDITPKFQIS